MSLYAKDSVKRLFRSLFSARSKEASPTVNRGECNDEESSYQWPQQVHVQPEALAYWILLQYGCGMKLRQELAGSFFTSTASNKVAAGTKSATAMVALYQRAGLRTPMENARRDWQGGIQGTWLEYLILTLCHESAMALGASALPPTNNDMLLLFYLDTSGRRSRWIQQLQQDYQHARIHIIDLWSDPYGWNPDDPKDENGNQTKANLENLNSVFCCMSTLIESLETKNKGNQVIIRVAVVIESLTPLLQRHGVARTMQFCRRLQQPPAMILITPVVNESMTPTQHCSFEDASQAVLILERGEAVLLRRSARESANLVRDGLVFDIVDGKQVNSGRGSRRANQGSCRMQIKMKASELEQEESKSILSSEENTATFSKLWKGTPPSSLPESLLNPDTSTAHNMSSIRNLRPHVSLQHEPEQPSGQQQGHVSPAATALPPPSSTPSPVLPQPHIIVEDDDPEFDDYDEEDPDDDLDL